LSKYLVISKKSSTFAPAFEKKAPFHPGKTDEKPQGFEEERKSNGAL
jgi:hypothetical protein